MLPSDSGSNQDEEDEEGLEDEPTVYVLDDKTEEGNDEDELQAAYEACKNQEVGVQESALLFGVSQRKLRLKLNLDEVSVIDEQYRVLVPTDFPLEAEIEIAQCLQDLTFSHVHMTNIDVRRFGYEMLRLKYRVPGLPRGRNCILGEKWYRNLMEKFPHLNVSHPDFKTGMEDPNSFYDSLENFVNVLRLDSTRIFYMDGIHFRIRAATIDDPRFGPKKRSIYAECKAIVCTNPEGMFVPPILLKLPDPIESNSCDVYDLDTDGEEIGGEEEEKEEEEDEDENQNQSRKGKHNENEKGDDNDLKVVGEVRKGCKKDENQGYGAPVRTTRISSKVIYNSKARRNAVPPSEDVASIREEIKAHLSKSSQSKSDEDVDELRENLQERFREMENKLFGICENTSPVTPRFFYSWFEKFLSHVRRVVKKKILLLLCEPSFIKYFKTLDLAREYGVVFLVLPPNSVHKIYPLDGVTMSLARNMTVEAKRWLGKHREFKKDQVPVNDFFKKAYKETVNPSIAKIGFLYSGLWPVNRNIFRSRELPPANFHSGVADTSSQSSSGTESLLQGITTESDIQKLCRICMRETTFLKPLFEPPPSLELNYHGKKMAELSNIPVSPGDGLPSSICQYCIIKLLDAIKMRRKAAESHRKQLKLLEAYYRVYHGHGDHEDRELLLLLQEFASKNYTKMINKLLSKTFDMNSICRVCMNEKPLMTPIFFLKTEFGNTYNEETCQKIMLVSQCQVHIQDGMSGFICPFCRGLINQAYEFIHRIVDTHQKYREMLSKIRTGTVK